MKSWVKRLLPVAVCLLLSQPARPAAGLADMPLERLLELEVEGASRFVQPLAEAPSAVSVVTAEDVRRFGFRHLGDALQSLRGVYTTNERDYTYLGIRGFARPGDYNTRMLMMIDGVRVNDPIYDTAPIGHEAPIEMEWIKRLEFVPGPGSALYGANAIFGVSNAILLSGADLRGSRMSADIGSHGLARAGLMAGNRDEEGRDWIIGISGYGRRGEDLHFPEFATGGSDGIARGLDGERYLKAFAKFAAGEWQASANVSSRRKDVPTAYYSTLFNVPGNFIQDDYGYLSVAHARTLGRNLTQNLRLRAGTYRYEGEYVSTGLLSRDETRAAWYGIDYLLTYTGLNDHKVLVGAEMQRNQRQVQRYFDVSPAAPHLDDHRRSSSFGLFLQDEWRLNRRWMTNLGARFDHISGFSAVSPRAAVIFHPVPEAAVKFITGRAFRAPNSYERFYHDGDATQKANPDLRPERITTNELVLDYAFTSSLRLSGSYYHYNIERLIEQATDPVDQLAVFVNRPPIHASGMEVELESLFRNGIRIKGGLAKQALRESGTAVNSPQRLAKLQVDGPFFDQRWLIGAGLRAASRRHGINGDVPGHVAGNVVVTRKNTDGLGEWSLSIYNIAGKRYLDPASSALTQAAVPQDGREYRIGWKLDY